MFDCVGGIILSALVLGTRYEPESEGKDVAVEAFWREGDTLEEGEYGESNAGYCGVDNVDCVDSKNRIFLFYRDF